MKTGYFARMKHYSGIPVSIALYTPKGVPARQYPALCPSPQLLGGYKAGLISKEEYVDQFTKQLTQLDAVQVYQDLGDDAILLCYEKAGDFCHRQLVAGWFEQELGVKVPEA